MSWPSKIWSRWVRNFECRLRRTGFKAVAMTTCLTLIHWDHVPTFTYSVTKIILSVVSSATSRVKINVSCFVIKLLAPVEKWFQHAWQQHLRRLAREVIFIPMTLGHCTAFQFGLNTRELCFCRRKTGPLVISTSDFSFMFLALGIFTTDKYRGQK